MARKEIGSAQLHFGRQSHGGPFLDGDVYVVVGPSNGSPEVWKSGTDPLVDTWVEQDTGNAPSNARDNLWVHQVGSELHIVGTDNLTTDIGRISYHVFNTSSNTWTTIDTVVSDPSANVPAAGFTAFIHVQTDGDLLVVGIGENDKVKGTSFDRVDFWRDTGGGFSGPNALDEAGEIDYRAPCGLGVGNRVHAFYVQQADGASTWTGSHRTIRDADTLSSRTALALGNNVSFGKGVHYDDGGTERCRMPYLATNDRMTVLEFDDGDSPTITENTNASEHTVTAFDGPDMSLSIDTKEVWMLYGRITDSDIYSDSNDDDAGWGDADVEEEDAIIASKVWSSVYDRSGLKLAYTYRDGSSGQFYNEKDIAAGEVSPLATGLLKKRVQTYLRY